MNDDPNPLRRAAHLPRSANAWEVGLVHVPIDVDGREIHGAVYVLETGTARIRALLPLAERTPLALLEALSAAMQAPHGEELRAERPLQVLVEDKDLAAELTLPLSGVGVPLKVVPSLPSKDEAARLLRQVLVDRMMKND